MTENCKFRKAILSAFYNISQRNFGILLILWCSFKLWWNFCLDQNLVYNANGPLISNIWSHVRSSQKYFVRLAPAIRSRNPRETRVRIPPETTNFSLSSGRCNTRTEKNMIKNMLWKLQNQMIRVTRSNFKFFVGLHGDKTYNSFVCGNTT
jgi:hypothetical protein